MALISLKRMFESVELGWRESRNFKLHGKTYSTYYERGFPNNLYQVKVCEEPTEYNDVEKGHAIYFSILRGLLNSHTLGQGNNYFGEVHEPAWFMKMTERQMRPEELEILFNNFRSRLGNFPRKDIKDNLLADLQSYKDKAMNSFLQTCENAELVDVNPNTIAGTENVTLKNDV
jgi:hypothetical protein